MFVCGAPVHASTDEAVKSESEKTVEPNKSASAATNDGHSEVKVTPLHAVESRSVRSKRKVTEEGKSAHSDILFLRVHSCLAYLVSDPLCMGLFRLYWLLV